VNHVLDVLPGWIFGLSVLALAGTALWRARAWLAGRPARVDVVRGLLALPGRYLIDVHAIVEREPAAARMHVPTAGGLLGASILIVLVHIVGWKDAAFTIALLALLGLMAVGIALVVLRRGPPLPARLSRGAWNRLSLQLALFAAAFGMATAADMTDDAPAYYAAAAALLAAWSCAVLIVLAPLGPMRHALAGALHLAFHPRPERFGAERPDAALPPLDLAAPKLGVETPVDFAWNRLLGFDACVQCGRCEAACPAFAAGQPLNPKKLIQDLVVGLSAEVATDAGYAGSPHPGRTVGAARGGRHRPVIGDLVAPDTLWACTTCRACVEECPMTIEHVDAVVFLRRFQVLEAGAAPAKAAEALDALRLADNPGARDPATRFDWAADLRLRVLAPGESCDVLLWAGDGAFDLRHQRTLRALVALLRRAGLDFAVLGAEECDCGDLARRLGDEATFQQLARRNVATLAGVRFARILTADPHAFHCLRNEYPALGGRYEVVHHTALLAALVADGRLGPATRIAEAVTYHDPCYLGRYNGEIAAPRAVLGAAAADVREMARHGMRSSCCGGGGGAPLSDVPGRRRIPDVRMDMARETGAAVVAVACPNCAVMLEGVVGPRPRVADVAELLAEAVAA